MVQKNNKHMRPAVRPAVKAADRIQVPSCDCDASCKCGCQEGKACTCDKGCGCGCDKAVPCSGNIANGILVLIGTLFIAGATLVLADKVESLREGRPMPAARPVAAAKMNDKAIADFIKNNPQVIIDSVNTYYQKQQAEKKAATPRVADKAVLDQILNDKTNHVLGNPNGQLVMIEFFDYNCGFCKMMNKKIPEALKKTDNIRWVLMDYPIFGEKSEIIAKYAFAASKQGKFAEYHEALGNTNNRAEADLKEIGKKLGLDVEKLAKDAHSEEAAKKLATNREYIQKLQLGGGVPIFIIDGKINVGAFQDEQMEEYIKKANDMKKAAKKAKK